MGLFGLSLVKKQNLVKLREDVTSYQRTLEDIGWINMSTDYFHSSELIAGGYVRMLKRVRLYFFNSPLAGLWVNLTTAFVFGEGVSKPKAKDPKVQLIVDEFWEDKDNKKSLTAFIAQKMLSDKIQVEGNMFFMLFDDEEGNIKVRLLNADEVTDIVIDQDDRMRPLFYKVALRETKYNFGSDSYTAGETKWCYIPDVENFKPEEYSVPANKLRTDCRIFHFKINCDINDKFGVPDLYRGLDWIKAHKDMAGDVATLVKALSRFAWKKKIKGTPAQVNALQGAMNAKTNLSNANLMSGGTQIENDGVDLQSVDVKTGGVDVGEKGLKSMQLMVSAASGLYYHYFGDPSTGNLATTKSMELPMIKKFTTYQALWREVFMTIMQYNIDRKIDVGLLDGSVEYDEKEKRNIYTTSVDRTIDIDFPPILENDLKTSAEAISVAKNEGLIGNRLASRLFMLAANVDNIDDETEEALADDAARQAAGAVVDPLLLPSRDPKQRPVPGKALPDPNAPEPKVPAVTKQEPPVDNLNNQRIREALDAPSKNGTRLARKNNYLSQRMNAYRKALQGHFTRFQNDIKRHSHASGDKGKVVGNIDGVDHLVKKFADGMKASARTYFPEAVSIGEKYTQSHLKDNKIKVQETLYVTRSKADDVLKERIEWNDGYIDDSLTPDMIDGISGTMKVPYDESGDFRQAVADKVNSFASRVDQYVGAFWTVEEAAVKAAGAGTGLQVNFVGEDDGHTCQGCSDALDGNPHDIDDAPQPGEQDCLGNCRHALQIVDSGEEV